MAKIFNKKFLYLIGNFFVFIAVFILLEILLQESFFFLDDFGSAIMFSDNIFYFPINGIPIASFFDRFFGNVLPQFLNIHPSEVNRLIFSHIESFVMTYLFFTISKIFRFKKDFNFTQLVYFIFTAAAILYFVLEQPLMLFVYDGFFRMFFAAVLWIFLFLILEKNLVITIQQKVFTGLMTFLVCTSNEMICITTLTGLMIYAFFHKKENKNFSYILALCALLGFILIFSTGAFSRKCDDDVFSFQVFANFFTDKLNFCYDYFKYIIVKHALGLSLIIIQIATIKIKIEENENVKRTIHLAISFLAGIFIFFFMLKALGRTHYQPGNYWLIHEDLHVIYSMIIFTLNSVLLKIIIENQCIKAFIVNIFLIVSTTILLFFDYQEYSKVINEKIRPHKKIYYQIEKILRVASLHKKTALLDESYYEDLELHPFFFFFDVREKNRIYKNSFCVDLLNQIEKDEDMKIIYGFMYTDKEKADKDFANNNGMFSEEELQNINFNNLLDKEFLLNNKTKK